MEKNNAKKLEKAIEKLRANLVLVEGKRDKKALELLGCENVLAVAGRKNQLANLIKIENELSFSTCCERIEEKFTTIENELSFSTCSKVNNFRDNKKIVIVATDLDKSGNELAEAIKSEIEGFAQVDCETRRELGKLLRLKYFEDIKRKYEEFYENEG